MLNKSQNLQTNVNPVLTSIAFQFFYVSAVAAMLRVGTPIIYKLILEGKLDAVKIGRAWKIPEASIRSYIASLSSR